MFAVLMTLAAITSGGTVSVPEGGVDSPLPLSRVFFRQGSVRIGCSTNTTRPYRRKRGECRTDRRSSPSLFL